MSIATSAFEGDQHAGGAFINVTIKSGTNAVHGSLFEDNTNQTLQLTPGTNHALPKAPWIDNQFGGLGGPIKKDKMFYFASYQGDRLVEGNSVLASVPTASMKQGNLSAQSTPIYDPMTGNADGTGRTAFSGTSFPPRGSNSGIQAMLIWGPAQSQSNWHWIFGDRA